MIVKKGTSIIEVIKWNWYHFLWLTMLMGSIALLYHFKLIEFKLPWVPVSVVGTAVAFFVGFKNNQAYDRLWEARKIWGGIVNSSRSWGMQVDGFVSNQFSSEENDEKTLNKIKTRLIYRHIAWLYTHRSQLLVPTAWEHINQGFHMEKTIKSHQKKFGVGLYVDEITQTELKDLLPKNELQRLINNKNSATQIINEQSRDLQELRSKDLIDDFRHMKMSQTLTDFYTHQGKNERIKKFPLPQQYANMSRVFVGIFIFLLPFSIIPELMSLGDVELTLLSVGS
jgi:putative membrane protein